MASQFGTNFKVKLYLRICDLEHELGETKWFMCVPYIPSCDKCDWVNFHVN
jgi:hypothetical protein